MRGAVINLRARPKKLDLINHGAGLLDKKRSHFILEAACERAQAAVPIRCCVDVDKTLRAGVAGVAQPHSPAAGQPICIPAVWGCAEHPCPRSGGITPNHSREAFEDTRQRVHHALPQLDTDTTCRVPVHTAQPVDARWRAMGEAIDAEFNMLDPT